MLRMMIKRSAANQHKYHIQLLAGGSVVLVEVRGYESEIFMPQLQVGRIALVNVIHSRRNEADSGRGGLASSKVHGAKTRASRKLTTATAGTVPVACACSGSGSWSSGGGAAGHAGSHKPSFSLKLISTGNVVLVECNGYESEIFLPHICSHCVTMKRVTASELVQCSCRRSRDVAGETVVKQVAQDKHLTTAPMHANLSANSSAAGHHGAAAAEAAAATEATAQGQAETLKVTSLKPKLQHRLSPSKPMAQFKLCAGAEGAGDHKQPRSANLRKRK